MELKSETFGYDAASDEYVDLIEKGIVDPAKVVRRALQDAASVAGLLVTTEAMVAETPKEPAPMPPGGGGSGWHGRRDGLLSSLEISQDGRGPAKSRAFFNGR